MVETAVRRRRREHVSRERSSLRPPEGSARTIALVVVGFIVVLLAIALGAGAYFVLKAVLRS
jgi:hypothetical protein